jgi:hypothetical protein
MPRPGAPLMLLPLLVAGPLLLMVGAARRRRKA